MTTFLNDSDTMLKQFQEPVNWGRGFYYISAVIASGLFLFILALWQHQRKIALGIMSGMVIVVSCLLFSYVIPIADKYLQSTLRDYSRIAANQMDTTDNLVVYGINKPSILFYAKRPATILLSSQRDKLTEVIESSGIAYIISKSSGIEYLTGHPDFYILNEQRGYTLAVNKRPDWLK